MQDPDEAEVPGMPSSARQHVAVDHCLGLKAIGRLLNSLAAEAVKKAPQLASHGGVSNMEYTADNPVAFTCSTCGGALRKVTKGTYTQFRCHIGHTLGTPELAKQQLEQLRAMLESSVRLLNERGKFFRATAGDARLAKQEQAATAWDAAAEQSEVRFHELTKLLAADWKRPELTPGSPTVKLRGASAEHGDVKSAVVPGRNRGTPKGDNGATEHAKPAAGTRMKRRGTSDHSALQRQR